MVLLSFGSRLYGRQDAQAQLQLAYERLLSRCSSTVDEDENNSNQTRPELVLIWGEAGSGKTTLAQTLQSTIDQDGGFYGNGKFDNSTSIESTIAAVALPLTIALAEWIYQIHERDDPSNDNNNSLLSSIRDTVLQQLSHESRAFLSRIIPGFEWIQPNQASPTPTSVERNPHYIPTHNNHEAAKIVISKFILAMTSTLRRFPFVLSLDDLHWGDDLTIDILHCVLSADADCNSNLLIIGTVRKHEWLPSLTRLLSLLQHDEQGVQCAKVSSISIDELREEDIQQMVKDVLKCSDTTTLRVSSRIFQQTKGNTLFVRQALQSLVDDSDLLIYRPEKGAWEWKDDEPKPLVNCDSNDLVSNLLQRMKQHDETVQCQLKLAACLGFRFPIDVWHVAMATGSILDGVLDPPQKITQIDPNGLVQLQYLTAHKEELQWHHDCLWQAAYSLISNEDRSVWHASIGLRLWQTLSEERVDHLCFLILHQLSFGVPMLTEKQENVKIAKLCLRAGEKAALSSSFRTAASCFKLGIRLLGNNDGWKNNYDLCLALRNGAAEACFCIVDFDYMDQQFDSVLQHAKHDKDTLRARTMQIYSLGSRGRFQEAFDKGMEALQRVGVRFPNRSFPLYLLIDFVRTQRMLRGKKDRSLLSLPLMKDETMLATMSILFVFIVTCSNYRPRLLPLITTCMVRRTLKYGLCPASSQAFLAYGVYLLHLGRRQEAYRFGQLALSVVQTLNAKEFLPRVYAGVYNYTSPFCRPLRESLDPLGYAHQAGLETGDLDMAAKCLFTSSRIMLWAGKCLPDVHAAMMKSYQFAKLYEMDGMMEVHKVLLQFLENLMVGTSDPLVLTGVMINQDDAYQAARQSDNQFLLVSLPMSRLWLALYLNDYELAWNMAAECRQAIQESNIAYFIVCIHRFLEGMVAASLSHHSSKREYLQLARRNLKELKQFERDSPENCQNKVVLLESELAYRNGSIDMALAKFERSASLAAEQGFVHEQALAYERAGIALRRSSDFSGSIRYLQKAKDLYLEWGADVKVRQMQQLYGFNENVEGSVAG